MTTDYSAAKVLTSKRNASVRMILPAAGARNLTTGALEQRTNGALAWSSSGLNSDNTVSTTNARHFGVRATAFNIGTSARGWGFNIRCIQNQE